LAESYQLVQFILKIGSALPERGGSGGDGKVSPSVDNMWQLLQLAAKRPWLEEGR